MSPLEAGLPHFPSGSAGHPSDHGAAGRLAGHRHFPPSRTADCCSTSDVHKQRSGSPHPSQAHLGALVPETGETVALDPEPQEITMLSRKTSWEAGSWPLRGHPLHTATWLWTRGTAIAPRGNPTPVPRQERSDHLARPRSPALSSNSQPCVLPHPMCVCMCVSMCVHACVHTSS